MIRSSLLFFLFISLALLSKSQTGKSFVLNLYGGYVAKDKLEFSSYKGHVNGGLQYGAGIEYFVQPNASFELKYQRMDTKTPLFSNASGLQVNTGKEKATVQLILIGAYSYFYIPETTMLPYIGTDLGIGMLKGESGDTRTGFAWNIKVGTRFNTNSAFSFKIQAYAQSISRVLGDKYYVDQTGAAISVGKNVSMLQFGFCGIAGISLSGKRRN